MGLKLLPDAPPSIVQLRAKENKGSKPTESKILPQPVVMVSLQLNEDGSVKQDAAAKARDLGIGINSIVALTKPKGKVAKGAVGVVLDISDKAATCRFPTSDGMNQASVQVDLDWLQPATGSELKAQGSQPTDSVELPDGMPYILCSPQKILKTTESVVQLTLHQLAVAWSPDDKVLLLVPFHFFFVGVAATTLLPDTLRIVPQGSVVQTEGPPPTNTTVALSQPASKDTCLVKLRLGRNAKSGTTSTDQLAYYNVKEALAHFDTDDTKVVHWFRCLQQSEKLARDYAEGAGSKPTYLVVKTDTVEVPFQIGVSNTFKKSRQARLCS